MKSPLAITLSVIALSAAASLASPLENEFLQLREKRDKALATVAEPINDGYRASLEQLLQRANTEEDKDTAAKIRFELQALKAATPATNPPEQEPRPHPGNDRPATSARRHPLADRPGQNIRARGRRTQHQQLDPAQRPLESPRRHHRGTRRR
jgi:hypothetical protein